MNAATEQTLTMKRSKKIREKKSCGLFVLFVRKGKMLEVFLLKYQTNSMGRFWYLVNQNYTVISYELLHFTF